MIDSKIIDYRPFAVQTEMLNIHIIHEWFKSLRVPLQVKTE